MKEISKEKFVILYDELSKHLTNTKGNMKTVGIEKGDTNKALTKMWELGKEKETITLIIAYHYSRANDLLLKLPKSTALIKSGTSLSGIQKILGICLTRNIKREEFEREFDELWENGFSLEDYGIGCTPVLESYWDLGYKWEMITALIIFKELKTYGVVKIETDKGRFKFKRADYSKILETLKSTSTKP